jgi:hypothetical protein
MKFGQAFSYVFKDPDWFKKIIIPALCGLIPVVGQFIVIGYTFKVAKKLITEGTDTPLPVLDFGADLGKGFMVTLITLLFILPVMILGSIAGGVGGAIAGAYQDVWKTVLGILSACVGVFAGLFALLIAFILPPAIANYAAKDVFKAAFNFKEIFGMIKKSFKSWLLVFVGGLLTGLIAPLGSIACGIGVILTTIYAAMVNYHLIGQAYNVSNTPVQGEIVL